MPTYPAAPDHRMAYDIDGSLGYYYPGGGGATTTLNSGQMSAWNNETNSDYAVSFGSNGYYTGLIFPELRDMSGFMVQTNYSSPQQFQTSTDSTNGQDGTWTTRIAGVFPTSDNSPKEEFRTTIQGLIVSGIKAVKFYSSSFQYNFHIFGQTATGANPDRLIMWQPVTNAALAANTLDPGDGGDVTRGQVYDKTFRIKNNSATLTATNVDVSTEILTDNTPSVGAMYTLSYDGGPFQSTVTIPSIAPGAISNVLTVRFNVSPTAQNLVASLRVKAIPQTYA